MKKRMHIYFMKQWVNKWRYLIMRSIEEWIEEYQLRKVDQNVLNNVHVANVNDDKVNKGRQRRKKRRDHQESKKMIEIESV